MSGGVVRWIAQSAWVVALAAAAAWSMRVGVADRWAREETSAGLKRALEWTPERAEYHFQLALLLAAREANPSLAELGRAVELKPSDSRSWIEVGLRHEADGEYARAEQCLLRAATEDQQYLPRWTLTNYYYRRGDTQRFWEWARLAAQRIPGDSRPLIRLCGRVVEDGNLMERLASCDADVTAAYLAHLMEVGRGDVAGKVTLKVLAANRIEDLPLLMAAFDRMVVQGRAEQALEIWNGLAAHRRIPFGALDPAQGRSLTNGEFAVAPSSQGFDWWLPGVEGISGSREENPRGLRLTFSGRQPESCEALVEYLPVLENTGYELQFEYQTAGLPTASGLAWELREAMGRRSMMLRGAREESRAAERPEDLSAETAKWGRLEFVTPAGCGLVRLALSYQRTPGTTRIEGFISLRRMELKRTAQLPSGAGPRSRVM